MSDDEDERATATTSELRRRRTSWYFGLLCIGVWGLVCSVCLGFGVCSVLSILGFGLLCETVTWLADYSKASKLLPVNQQGGLHQIYFSWFTFLSCVVIAAQAILVKMSGYGFHCFAPDWLGFGISDKPQPGYGFDYTEKVIHEEFDKLLDVLGVKSPLFPRCSGSFGLTWTLKNPSKILKLSILNRPLTVSSPIPGLFQKLSLPGCLLCHIITSILSRRALLSTPWIFIHCNKPCFLASLANDYIKLCIITCGEDKAVKVWNAVAGTKLYTFVGHKAPVYSICPHNKENLHAIHM
ncbi:hypothetical protein CMV_012796 [Castanea mollissima]|uniref:Uncharacterized protein n=1 Tax=Castanea mollissima TaxID=60419 RepID=A0A8J4VXL6_9ROSI|nr:hypothetical protein CMV_012796 [Castanea mollissima]